ncbi:16 kDa phloem protein 1 [Cornus florida]|uniref:16 kDa phloem protein 1 n=1 Tax=Cornus florida TaxID=4283 RepID=UPI00289922D1|nr:16 kDa phloem protein 1 [Cornus florida]
MSIGILEVTLVDARNLKNTEFFGGGIDPYVLIQYKSQERKSSVARGQGSSPIWNEKFNFRVEYPGADDQYKLILKIMDKDTFSADDYHGQATIYLKDLLALGVENGTAELHPRKYSVVATDLTYCGEIRVGITFTPKVQENTESEDFGGWKESEN